MSTMAATSLATRTASLTFASMLGMRKIRRLVPAGRAEIPGWFLGGRRVPLVGSVKVMSKTWLLKARPMILFSDI